MRGEPALFPWKFVSPRGPENPLRFSRCIFWENVSFFCYLWSLSSATPPGVARCGSRPGLPEALLPRGPSVTSASSDRPLRLRRSPDCLRGHGFPGAAAPQASDFLVSSVRERSHPLRLNACWLRRDPPNTFPYGEYFIAQRAYAFAFRFHPC